MIKTVVLHKNTLDYVYVKARNKLVLKLETAKENFIECRLIYWARTESDIAKRQTKEMELRYRDNMLDYYYAEVEFPRVARYTKYFFELRNDLGETYYYTEYDLTDVYPKDGFFEYLYANPEDVIRIPEWAKGAVYYQIFPERFFNGDSSNDPKGSVPWGMQPTRENYMGGDIKGIIQKMDYIKDLGVDCIYLNPVFQGDFNHKYATTDYFQVDENFGTNEDLKMLVKECHERGMRLILDGVFNHSGTGFAPFADVMSHQEESNYKDWFHITKFPVTITHRDYECVGAYKWMPKLCTSNHEVRKFILEVMEFWIEYAGIDGWRLDVADEVDAQVWKSVRTYLKEKYPDILLLGETWSFGRKMLAGDQMDSVMNYIFRDAMLDFIAYKTIDPIQLNERLHHMMAGFYGEYNHAMYNLLDSHDTPRFLRSCKDDIQKLKLAAAFMFCMPGAPAIYYGDEVGITGDNDPDCRKAMVWKDGEQNRELMAWYQKLSYIRHQEEVIRKGSFKTVLTDTLHNIYGFERSIGKVHIRIIINNSEKESEIAVTTDYKVGQKRIIPLQGQENRNFSENGDRSYLKLEPYSVKIIKFEEVEDDEQSKKSTGNPTDSRYVPGSSHSLQ